MRYGWGFLGMFCVLAGCAAQQDHFTDEAAAQQQAAFRAQSEAAHRNEETRRAWKEREARDQAEREAAARAESEQKAQAHDAECAESRPQRLADVQSQVRDWRAAVARVRPQLKWMLAHCKVEDTRGVLVQHERTKEGVIVRTREVGSEAEPRCDAPKPTGLLQSDVDLFLLNTGDEVLYNGDFSDANNGCADSDKRAGLDLAVTLTDGDGQKALLGK